MRLKNHFGFSVLEVLVTGAVVATIALATTQLSQNFTKTASFAKSASDFNAAYALTNLLLDGPNSCTQALKLGTVPIPLSKLRKTDSAGNPVSLDIPIYFSGSSGPDPIIKSGQVIGGITITAVNLALTSLSPAHTAPTGGSNYRAVVRLVGSRKEVNGSSTSYGSKSIQSDPISLMLVSDPSGQNFVACSAANKGEGLPICGEGAVLNSLDNRLVGCADVPRAPSGLEAACGRTGGYIYRAKTGASLTEICVIPDRVCPIGMKQAGNWSMTTSNLCWGGSTSGCNMGVACMTGSHGFSDQGVETCATRTNIACGPWTVAGPTCYANVTRIGCILQSAAPPPATPPPPPPPIDPILAILMWILRLFGILR